MRPFDLMRAQQASLQREFLSGAVDPAYVFARASSASYFDQTGLLGSAPSGVIRFDWEQTLHTPNGLFMEEGRTNLCVRSSTWSNAAWVKVNVTGTAGDQTGPDGTLSYGSLTASLANGTVLQTITVVNGTTYQFSIDLKRLTGSGTIQITTDNGVTWNTVAVTSTLTRFVQQQVAVGTTMIVGVRIVTSADAVIAGGAGLEAGAFVTSRNPSGAGTPTRNRDAVSYVVPSGAIEGFNPNDMAFAVEVKVSNFVSSMRLASISDGTAANGMFMTTDASGNLTVTYVTNSTVRTITGPVLAAGTVYKIAMSVGTGGIYASVNGVIYGPPVGGLLQPVAVFNTMNLGIDSNGGVMWLRNLRLWRHGLTRDRVAAATT